MKKENQLEPILTPEEQKAKKDKEEKQALIIGVILVILMMALSKNYTSWILWALLGLFLIGLIPYLPNDIKEPLLKVLRPIFTGIGTFIKTIGYVLLVILVISGIIFAFCGLVTMSTTNFLLFLIFWALMSRSN